MTWPSPAEKRLLEAADRVIAGRSAQRPVAQSKATRRRLRFATGDGKAKGEIVAVRAQKPAPLRWVEQYVLDLILAAPNGLGPDPIGDALRKRGAPRTYQSIRSILALLDGRQLVRFNLETTTARGVSSQG